MYINNGIAYAGELTPDIEVSSVTVLDDMILLITFNTGETRLYDASALLVYPAFKPLENDEVFRTARIDHGILTWLDGDIDIAPETLYKNSIAYQPMNFDPDKPTKITSIFSDDCIMVAEQTIPYTGKE